ncbi:hypothetical protein [Xiamenia xianingshaonis]|uniref:Alternate signal-mediated exported protein n=1 Tax=Xiamenia xianingshaonis TaxID=2682776 RepID=A0A9E6SU95_9ACTN|nr:hypothetical protein [Xiamenia xianingshaonis]QTU84310.1 hypothetical protein J7S26_08205 [Xiamenia xianingshaonis]
MSRLHIPGTKTEARLDDESRVRVQARSGAAGDAKAQPRPLSKGTLALFALAIALLAFAGVGGAQASLTYMSEVYAAQLELPDIGITLQENGADVSWRDYTGGNDVWDQDSNNPDDATRGLLTQNMLPDGEQLMLGRTYPEVLTVKNTGTIDHYTRVKVSRYWVDENDQKLPELSPDLIDLHLVLGEGWVEDEAARTAERCVLYYTKPLASGEVTSPFADTLTISPAVAAKVRTTEERSDGGFTTITTEYDYNGVRFIVEAEADAVQDHNAVDAIKSAWGVDVTIDENGGLSLADGGR